MPGSAADIAALKGRKKIVAVTAYDYTMASLVDRGGADIVLVGDSAGMVVMGQDSTLGVGMDEMCLFTSSVAAARPSALVVADMPFMSYQPSPGTAVANAGRLVRAGAQAVKLEGGAEAAESVGRIAACGIPVMGHLGFQPQTGDMRGGGRRRGGDEEAIRGLVGDARALEDAGAFSIVLEMVSTEAAAEITGSVGIPTIGIGSGAACDGQVLVVYDLLGMYDRIRPAFAKRYREMGEEIASAVSEFARDVESGAFPAGEHGFSMGGRRS